MTKRNASARWAARIKRVGEALALDRLHPAVVAAARRRPRGAGWAVAFSGGADSLALLLVLRAHFPARRLVALHFNHRLRGRASDADARFCAKVCGELGVACVTGRWDRARARRRPGAGRPEASEAEARRARHLFFAREMKRRRLRVLWLGHQQDDVAETFLMRLARGSGAGGLAAPRPVQRQTEGRVFWRPLLTLKKRELTGALRGAGVRWREDASNAGDDFLRTRIRRRVLPAWQRAVGARDALAGAAYTRELLEEDDAALEAWLDGLDPLDGRGRLELGRLAGMPRAVVRRALHRWLLAVRPETDLSRAGFAQLLERVVAGGPVRFSLGAKGFAVAKSGRLVFEAADRARSSS